jgi:allantoicase
VSAFLALPDLASRALGGAVVAWNDASFADAENLILPHPPVRHDEFGHKGKVYDGWETRRRRDPGADWVIVRLGVPGTVAGVVVDTSFFTGNYPTAASLEGLGVEGYPAAAALSTMDWLPLSGRSLLDGDAVNAFAVAGSPRLTHVRLTIHPDGGVARLRVHGMPVPDPRLFGAGPLDLAALENGATIAGCSNEFYSRPVQLISPGVARSMGEGWETARRRGPGNDWVSVRLAEAGVVDQVELDTSYFLHNAPGAARLTGVPADDPSVSVELLPRTPLQPDTRHRFPLQPGPPVREVRLDVYPDGGMARLRLWGRLTSDGRSRLGRCWFDALPDAQAAAMLAAAGLPENYAGRRPTLDAGRLPAGLAALVDGPSAG